MAGIALAAVLLTSCGSASISERTIPTIGVIDTTVTGKVTSVDQKSKVLDMIVQKAQTVYGTNDTSGKLDPITMQVDFSNLSEADSATLLQTANSIHKGDTITVSVDEIGRITDTQNNSK